MPKILDNPKEKLLEEARRQVEDKGYSAMTIRSVAKACHVSVGTVYNYFPSKEALVAAYMLQDWKICLEKIEASSKNNAGAEPILACMYEQLSAFAAQYDSLFSDAGAATGAAGSFSQYHKILRDQLAAPLIPLCKDEFCAQFIAEAMLVWTLAGKQFPELYQLIQKLL